MSCPIQQLLSQRSLPLLMGILNITPDSFSDGGELFDENGTSRDRILRTAQQMIAGGVDIFDVGGESTRPGASPVTTQQELGRVIPVVEWLVAETDIPVSVDTSSPAVMTESAIAGASMINDVRALQREGALQAAASSGLTVCLMHMQGEPDVMQQLAQYDDVLNDVTVFLRSRVDNCLQVGIDQNNIILDPGFGFGKSLEHNLKLFQGLPHLKEMGYPVLAGVSRKSMIGAILDKPVEQRLQGSVAMALLAAQRGAAILRVHDVAETLDALRVWQVVEQA